MKTEFWGLKLTVVVLFPLLLSCSEDTGVQPNGETVPVVSNLIAPEFLFNGSQRLHTISVAVQEPQGREDIQSVTYAITKMGSGSPLSSGEMVDDGTGGDIIPKDAVFTTQIRGTFAGAETGQFELTVQARDISGNTSAAITDTFIVLAGTENLPPEIVNVAAPQTVAIDSAFSFVVIAQVNDNEGLSDIRRVTYQFFPPAHPNPTVEDTLSDSGQSGDVTPGDGIFSATLNSSRFKEVADYFVRFEAEDRSGNLSQPKVISIRGRFRINHPPMVSNLMAPDTVQIDPNRTQQFLITIDASDPDGLSDIEFVRFRSFLPSGEEANNSPIQMSDDGDTQGTGDAEANDGTYSVIINLPPSGVTPGDFRFVFEARDRSRSFSNRIEHIMTVIE